MVKPTGGVETSGGRPDDVEQRVARVAEPIAAALGVEVVAVRYAGTRTAGTVRITVDKPGGVTLDDCARLSRAVGHALDVDDPIEHRYTLEVSSPGLDRALETPRDYEKAVGRRVRVKTRPSWEGPRLVIGRLKHVDAEAMCIEAEDGEWTIPCDRIAQARLEVEW